MTGRIEAPLWRPPIAKEENMSSKSPTHTAYVVIDPKEGSDKKAQWFEIGTVWSHNDASGFDVMIPPGVTVTGRIVCRKRKQPNA
jgi:hypothetical protein